LALTYEKPHRFREDDSKLIEGLAQQLAITIQRLEATYAQQIAEQRATTAEVMGSIGQQSFQLAHRLSNDLGLVRSYVNDISEELQIQDILDFSHY
jgi:GAF domain-containing protein